VLRRQLMREGAYPTRVAQRMNFHPDSILPFVQFERPRAARNPKVPMTAAGAPGKLALISDDETAGAALLERFCRRKHKIELQHRDSNGSSY